MTGPSVIERTRLRLPVKLKLALVSAGLTFAILLLFALAVGTFTERRLNASFDNDLRATAADLQDAIRDPEPDASLLEAASAGGAVIRVFDADGHLVAPVGRTPDLGPPIEALLNVGDYRVFARPLGSVALRGENNPLTPLPQVEDAVAGYVQYAKPRSTLRNTITKVRLFLAFGVLGGTALAFLAGWAVARRAMRPIAGLTRAAREVARTRDPAGVKLPPKPEAHDEVAELADTLEEMLTELGDARAESEAALTRQRAFVADASHELRTPLTSILANLELLEAELEGEQRDMAGSALRSSKRMSRLVGDLLLLARADAGRQAARSATDLTAIVREAVAEAAPLGSEGQISLQAPEAVPIEGASDDLHRMALNLIENALVHTPQGTPVTVSVRREGADAVLEVSDRGPGIPAEMRERVFERFARGAGAGDVTPTRAGSGLGLALARAVAQAHEGKVELDEAPGGGARFVLRLPAGPGLPAVAPRAERERA